MSDDEPEPEDTKVPKGHGAAVKVAAESDIPTFKPAGGSVASTAAAAAEPDAGAKAKAAAPTAGRRAGRRA